MKESTMNRAKRLPALDKLRLIGLGRVPACAECPRYRDLVAVYKNPALCGTTLAAVPKGCPHAYCQPLAQRYGAYVEPAWTQRRAAG